MLTLPTHPPNHKRLKVIAIYLPIDKSHNLNSYWKIYLLINTEIRTKSIILRALLYFKKEFYLKFNYMEKKLQNSMLIRF